MLAPALQRPKHKPLCVLPGTMRYGAVAIGDVILAGLAVMPILVLLFGLLDRAVALAPAAWCMPISGG